MPLLLSYWANNNLRLAVVGFVAMAYEVLSNPRFSDLSERDTAEPSFKAIGEDISFFLNMQRDLQNGVDQRTEPSPEQMARDLH